ncbi:amino acid permease [Vulcanimicrobium alpinum]|uniref:Amino acid permease n=1 Tax=Vulcanimicrobium alpinum TaxID=3016050 RepID=A0AAN2CAD1_UNVUL|nr:APC family permease [Vulcanimicrobium alpinum]BDE07229.1 amino acid permease [Vulcanimicrobium alpinum]
MLIRGVALRGAIAINVITMIGIGPLITVPLVLGALHGPYSLAGWLAGALLALCDGLVWAELGSLFPGSGGTYGFLRSVFGARRWGALLAFLFVWQTIFYAPLIQASGYVGFANYAAYLVPWVGTSPQHVQIVAIGVGVLTVAALYRGIGSIAGIGRVLAVAAIATLLIVIVAAFAHFAPAQAFALPRDGFGGGLAAGFGQALVIAMYDYVGYGASSAIGDEVIDPAKTLPRSIVVSILLVGALYLTMQVGILGAVPWRDVIPAANGTLPPLGAHIASSLVERAFGGVAATIATLLVLTTAFASVFGNLLAFSRIPFAAAVDGAFLRPFARVDAVHRFPNVSLLTIGALALPASLFTLDQIINALTAGIVLVQPIAQIFALFALRRRGVRAPYRMWLFPLPALVALGGWTYLFWSSGAGAMLFGTVTVAAGVAVFAVRAAKLREWPFAVSG